MWCSQGRPGVGTNVRGTDGKGRGRLWGSQLSAGTAEGWAEGHPRAAPRTVEGRTAGKALQGGGPRKVLKREESETTLVLRMVPSPEGTVGGGRAGPRCMFSLLLLS